MNRRELLERIGLLLGGTVSASSIAAVLSDTQRATRGDYVPQTLTPWQNEWVATLAELIIPTTDTPGGRAARVNVFIDKMLTSIYTAEERKRFIAGLDDVEKRAKARGASFLGSRPETQIQILKDLEAESLAAQSASRSTQAFFHELSGTAEWTFFHELKELTLIGYYHSEIGATQELRYGGAVPGRYVADVSLKEVGRSWYGRGGTD